MQNAELISSGNDEINQEAVGFYRHVLEALNASGTEFLVGGAYAFNQYTAIRRHTKDLDIFIRRDDYPQVSEALRRAGYTTEMTYPHWLAKIRSDGDLIDLIFSSGNGVAEVDEDWFRHAIQADVLGIPVLLCPAEEMIWSKAFVMERERYDGADIVHLIRARGGQLDWQRLRHRFGPYWRILLSHLVMFGFVYPTHRDLIPAWIMDDLLERLRDEVRTPPPAGQVCLGPLLSREQYLTDIGEWGYHDARLTPLGNMTADETAIWTDAIQHKDKPS